MQLTTLSQSSLQDYVDCPRRFQLRYVDRLSYPAIESEPTLENEKHQQEGEYFHRLVQQYLIGIPAEQISKIANTPNLQRWWENFLNAKESFTNCPSTGGIKGKGDKPVIRHAGLRAALMTLVSA